MANVAGSFLEIIAAEADETPAARRRVLFRENPQQMFARWLMAGAYACHPKRIGELPFLIWHTATDMARGGTPVPSAATTQPVPEVFAGVCRDVTPQRILEAARAGFFPWSHAGPLKWWTRNERMVVTPTQFRMSKDARRLMRKGTYHVTFDDAFDEVIKACAEPRKGRPFGLTWITPQIMRLYAALHDLGVAHSFEVWNVDGQLVGGGYGIAVGRVFYTESQFSRESNTSKIGFACLNHHLAKWGFVLNDGKDFTPTLEQMGFRTIPRADFEAVLAEHGRGDVRKGKWQIEASPAEIADAPASAK